MESIRARVAALNQEFGDTSTEQHLDSIASLGG